MKVLIAEIPTDSTKKTHIVEMSNIPRVGDSIYFKQKYDWTVVEVVWCIEPEDTLLADVWIKVVSK